VKSEPKSTPTKTAVSKLETKPNKETKPASEPKSQDAKSSTQQEEPKPPMSQEDSKLAETVDEHKSEEGSRPSTPQEEPKPPVTQVEVTPTAQGNFMFHQLLKWFLYIIIL